MNSKSQASSCCRHDQTEHEYKRPTLTDSLHRKSSAHLIFGYPSIHATQGALNSFYESPKLVSVKLNHGTGEQWHYRAR
ncbi:hypothetical protein FOXYSP1_19821 [Fusarium oxysporum f. sp. phaseoli]